MYRPGKKSVTFSGIILLSLILVGCSSSNSVCTVNYDSTKDKLEVVVLPPKESGDAVVTIWKEQKLQTISDGKLSAVNMSIDRTVKYNGSGNSYHVTGNIILAVKDGKGSLDQYKLNIEGGIYGTTPYICEK